MNTLIDALATLLVITGPLIAGELSDTLKARSAR